MNRFYITPEEFEKDTIQLTGDNYKHAKKVLRLKAGDQVEIYNGQNLKSIGKVSKIDNNAVEVVLSNKEETERENKCAHVDLFQGVPKKGKLELIIQKNTELGVNNIYPFYSKYSVPTNSKNTSKKYDRYNRVALEASKQCGRGIVPKVVELKDFSGLIENLENYDLILMAYENEENKTLKDVVDSLERLDEPRKIAIIIGPEGGFSEEEVNLLKDNQAEVITLGNRILRTETAGMSLLSQLNYIFET